MTETADRYRKVAAGFTERVEAMPADRWDSQTPCKEWTARELVAHMQDAANMFLERVGVAVEGPSPDDDPVGAWHAARDALTRALDDPALAQSEYESPMGKSTLEKTIGAIGVSEALIHTWDLARAADLDDRLDPDEVHRAYEAMQPNDEMLRSSGMFGPAVPVADDADEQTRLLAFTGRQP